MRSIEQQRKNKIRYNLHYQVRRKGYAVSVKYRTILIAHDDESYKADRHINRLRNEFNYEVQLRIE